MGSLSFYIDGVERLAPGHEQPVALPTTKAHIGTHLWQQNLTDAVPIRGKDMNTVKTLPTPASGGPEVAVCIHTDAVSHARQPIEDHQGKPPPMLQSLTIADVPDSNFPGMVGIMRYP